MSSRKESKDLRTQKSTKQMAQNRRNILRLGALGAVAVLAANVMPGSDVRAATEQAGTRSVAKQGAQKVLHTPAAGKSARKAATVKSQGELSARNSRLCARHQAVSSQGGDENRQGRRWRAPGRHAHDGAGRREESREGHGPIAKSWPNFRSASQFLM